jgi:hypothetical protein
MTVWFIDGGSAGSGGNNARKGVRLTGLQLNWGLKGHRALQEHRLQHYQEKTDLHLKLKRSKGGCAAVSVSGH